jgi:DNA-binding NtrC family response regulator
MKPLSRLAQLVRSFEAESQNSALRTLTAVPTPDSTTNRRAEKTMAYQPTGDVIVIDDHPDHLDLVVTLLRRAGYGARGFTQPRRAVYHAIDHAVSLVVVDLCMPDMDGIEVVQRLQTSVPDVPLIGMTGWHDSQATRYLWALRELGAVACLRKPIDAKLFLKAVGEAIAHAQA